MFSRPASFQDFLSRNNHINEIYNAMHKDDLSEVVLTALDVLKRTRNLPPVIISCKSEDVSTLHRNAGNNAYKTGYYQKALVFYNQALLFAPKNSRAMKLAYSNRSALFYKLKVWNACNNDIEKCFAMGCPADILEKLTKRKESINSMLAMDYFSKNVMVQAAETCVHYVTKSHNPQISCASSDIKVVVSGIPKIVAATDVNVGTVVACETAFVSYTDSHNCLFSCHFCQKKTLNLIPCDGCCHALFCDEECRTKCLKDFHIYECKIMDAIKNICFGPMPNLMLKAILKLRTHCKSWKELITASYNTGIDRIESSSIEDIYDAKNLYSILTFNNNKSFIYGVLYNASFVCGAILYYLNEQNSSFLPTNIDEKQQSIRALARIMMYLSIYQTPLHIIQAQTDIKIDRSNYGIENFGLYPFIGKVKASCNPNVIVTNKNNQLVLIAIQSIKSGEELTVSYLWHWYDFEHNRQMRNIKTFLYHGTVCDCNKCKGDSLKNNVQLSKSQRKFFINLNINDIEAKISNIQIPSVYKTILHALDVLKDVPDSKEYITVYKNFRKCIFYFEAVYSDNNVLDCKI